MYICRSRYLARAEVWYEDDPVRVESADWIQFLHRSRPFPGSRWQYFDNYVIDLTRSAAQLAERLERDTAYRIRRARDRDRIVCDSVDARARGVLDRFEATYNEFATSRGLSRLDRGRIDGMAAAGVLDLSAARDADGEILVWHAYHRDRRRATQLHSPSIRWKCPASEGRNKIGRANRYLIWSDLLRYKAQGLTCFDFGGWYSGDSDPALLRINSFKREFGGSIVREYHCRTIRTLKAWIVLNAAALLGRSNCSSAERVQPLPQPQAVPGASRPEPASP